MKLYATTTSERASKGQGGNNELVINITVGNTTRREIANIVLRTSGGSLQGTDSNMYALEYYPVNRDKGGRIVLDIGELEPKGISGICNFNACQNKAFKYGVCKKHLPLEIGEHKCVMFYNGACDTCGKKKGKQQKGDTYTGSAREADDEAFDDAVAGGR